MIVNVYKPIWFKEVSEQPMGSLERKEKYNKFGKGTKNSSLTGLKEISYTVYHKQNLR